MDYDFDVEPWPDWTLASGLVRQVGRDGARAVMSREENGPGAHYVYRYRYYLRRVVGEERRTLLFVLLNPSTADAFEPDQTLRRCCHYAVRDGYGIVELVNLYALRSSTPGALRRARDPVGPLNDEAILWHATRADRVVVAWGAQGPAVAARAREVVTAIQGAVPVLPLWCLGTTREGHPRHPSRLSNAVPIVPLGALP